MLRFNPTRTPAWMGRQSRMVALKETGRSLARKAGCSKVRPARMTTEAAVAARVVHEVRPSARWPLSLPLCSSHAAAAEREKSVVRLPLRCTPPRADVIEIRTSAPGNSGFDAHRVLASCRRRPPAPTPGLRPILAS